MIYIVGELKNPLLYKNIMMPIIGPNPNTKSTNLADHPFLISNPENAKQMAEFRIFSLKKFQ